MPRYIDADYLLKELSFYADRPTKSAMKMIKNIALHPANVVERKKGKWEEKAVFDEPVIEQWQSARCSVCGLYHTTPYSYYFTHYKFCPICGADMRGDKNDD